MVPHSVRPSGPTLLRAALFAAASTLSIGAAHAQQAADATELSTIVVEGTGEKGDGPVKGYVAKKSRAGTKTDTPIEKTAQSIAVVPKQQMQDQQVQSVAESLRYTPGVFAEYRGASNLRDEIFTRGFYYTPRYLDGLFLGGELSYAKIDPYLLERVELIGGPSSVLYGQANPGGLINEVSKKPTDAPLREVQFSYGTDRHFGAAVDFSDRLFGSDTLAWRLAASGLSTDLQENFTKQRSIAVAPSLTWTPDAETKLTLLGGYQNEPKAGYRNFLDAAGTVYPMTGYGYVPRDLFISDPDYEHASREQAWLGYEFERKLSDTFTFRQNARYQYLDWDHRTLVYGSASYDAGTGHTLVSRNASGGSDDWRQFAIDNQLQADFQTGALDHTLLAGLDYRYRTRDYVWGRASAPSLDLNDPQYGGSAYSGIALATTDSQDLTAYQVGLYLQDQIEIGNLNLSAGLRHDWASTDIDDRLDSDNNHSYDDGALTWRLGALYAFDNGLAPYVSYSTSFEPSLYAPEAGGKAFDPTTAGQFEIGVKYAPEGTNLLFTAAYYDLRQKDVVQGTWNNTFGRTVYSQIGAVHNQGVELSARANFDSGFSLTGAYSYISSEITDTITANELGKTPARIPEHQASLWGTYAFSSGALDGLTLGAGVRYIGKSWGNNTNTFEVDDTTLFDAMASYDFGALDADFEGLSLQVNVKNIADTEYVASCASAYACFYGSGRTVLATLKKTW
ncbi:TonB-dependent siderophore receptor [Pleomorphomonas carboxyditropha]|uniref:TonB-dependent siderophore receptor n=1 Tax=Pleomorphomonas carboxyditropha TaxID=2023338 RepID=A0A2G9WQJ3_9HYPH|nr:TonB-dependent siderophore receptor [Pleomorphomonas carboxyditropha]PIO96976.1 TonB-dependent siderophore receptor [Pleomorphomonas carboxyditropha]